VENLKLKKKVSRKINSAEGLTGPVLTWAILNRSSMIDVYGGNRWRDKGEKEKRWRGAA
jgi:hypothetical protein